MNNRMKQKTTRKAAQDNIRVVCSWSPKRRAAKVEIAFFHVIMCPYEGQMFYHCQKYDVERSPKRHP